jgi:hypothetical protein
LLFELMLALSLFAMTALALLAILSQAASRVDRSREMAQAADMARSAMSLIEAGILDPVALNGEPLAWDPSMLLEQDFESEFLGGPDSGFADGGVDPFAPGGPDGGFGGGFGDEGQQAGSGLDSLGAGSGDIGFGSGFDDPEGWTLEIETESSSFDGLTLVIIRVTRFSDEISAEVGFTLRQFVRLGSEADDTAGDLNALPGTEAR